MFTWVEIKTEAIQHNLREFRKLIGSKRLLMPVIKSNAYGHGFLGVAKICEESREVDRICVVNDTEAELLLENNIKKPIFILSYFSLEKERCERLVCQKVIFPLYTLDQAKFLNKIGEQLKCSVRVHLKIDTGAARIGILPKELENFSQEIKKFNFLDIEGVWSHFASSENDEKYSKKQIKIFNKVLEILKKQGIVPPIKHMSCSAASVNLPLDDFNAIRLGLSLYGLQSSEKNKKKISLKPALSWYTKIVQIKNLPVGEKVGYGGTFITKKPTKLAIVPVGYYEGYDRKLSNTGEMLIKGNRCQVRGRVCMNLCMVDITAVKKIKVGDRVVILGDGGRHFVTAEELAKKVGTLNYEIISRINPVLPRIFR